MSRRSTLGCEKPGHIQSRCLMKVCLVCRGRGHSTEQCDSSSRAVAVSASKYVRDGGDCPDPAGMMTVEWTSCGVTKAGRGGSEGLSDSASRVDRYIIGCDQASSTVSSALFVNADDEGSLSWQSPDVRSLGVASPGTVTRAQRDVSATRGVICTNTSHGRVGFSRSFESVPPP